jgi:esterase/lipase
VNKAFNDYLSNTKKDLENYKNDQRPLLVTSEQRTKFCMPFEVLPENPNDKAVLLIHGLLDSPYSVRAIGLKLAENGYVVRSILLPDHGTSPIELCDSDYLDWIESSKLAIENYFPDTSNLSILAMSTGAMLALHYALQNDKRRKIDKIIAIAPPIQLKTNFAWASKFMVQFGLKWLNKAIETNPSRYLSCPYNAGVQLNHLSSQIKNTDNTDIPLMMILTNEDETVDSKAAVNYIKKYRNKKVILYNKQHKNYKEDWIISRTSVYADKNINGFSHVCLTFPPEDPLYGEKSLPASIKLGPKNGVLAKLYGLFPFQSYSARLGYNPDFEFMVNEILEFLNR